MTTYDIHPRGGMWCVGAAGKPVTWFHNKHEAEAWVDAQDAQGGRDDVVRELKAIRDAVYILVLTVLVVFFLSIFIWDELANGIDTSSQSTTPSLDSSRVEPFTVPSVALGNQPLNLSVVATAIGISAVTLTRRHPVLDFALSGESLDRGVGVSAHRPAPRCPGFWVRGLDGRVVRPLDFYSGFSRWENSGTKPYPRTRLR